MPKLRLIDEQNKVSSVPSSSVPETIKEPSTMESKYVTTEQLDNKLGGVVDQIVKKIEPESALTPEVRGVVKAVDEIQRLRNALQSPASVGIEEATSTLVTTVLGNALQNITGGGQQQVQAKPLKNTLAEIAVHNLTGADSPLPRIMDAATTILGPEKVKEGYNAGMQYIEQQQNQSKLPNVILQLNENSQEDVVFYADKMGYSDVQYAQTMLIEHKNRLYQEIEEYQRIQQGGQQNVAVEESVVQEQNVEEPVAQQEVVKQQYEPTEQALNERIYGNEPVASINTNKKSVTKEPVMKANKVVVLHSKPRKLILADDGNRQDNDYEVNVDKNHNIDVIYNEDNEDKNNSEDDELSNIDDIIEELGE